MRQLILCCDGTNNNFTGGEADTHVVRLCELLVAQGDADQRVFYDPGVGNSGQLPGATFVDQFRRQSDRIAGLAFGRGVFENIEEGYRFLMREYQPGDQIFVFGFSRGAFTARSIAGLINRFGVLRPESRPMVPTLLHVYFSKDVPGKSDVTAQQIRRTLAHSFDTAVHFVGVWDTVASVGFKPFQLRLTAKPTLAKKRFIHVRQALALDEMRSQFMPRLYAEENGTFECAPGHGQGTLEQLWFRGSHCDVGGGYAPGSTRLSRQPFAWLVAEAVAKGLRLSHAGQPLDNEAAVLATLPPVSDAPLVHSEAHRMPLWALAGMSLRRNDRAEIDDMPDPLVRPVEHPSVAAWPATFPKDTDWRRWNLGKRDAVMLFLLLFCPWAMQYLGGGQEAVHGFAHWQLFWWRDGPVVPWPECQHLLLQLLLDLPFMLAWAWFLSSFAVRAFARRAGLRRANSPRPAWLQLLGRAPMVAVLADVAEDAASAVVLGLMSYGHGGGLASIAAVLMSLASAAKWLAIGGTLLLIVSGLLPPRKSRGEPR